MQLCSYQSSSVSQSSRQTILCFPMWLILSHSELPGDEEDSYSFLLQSNLRYLGFTACRYSGSVSMVQSSSTRLSSAGTPSRTSSFVQGTILIFYNMGSPLILLSLGKSNTSSSTTEVKFSTCVRLVSSYRFSSLSSLRLCLVHVIFELFSLARHTQELGHLFCGHVRYQLRHVGCHSIQDGGHGSRGRST